MKKALGACLLLVILTATCRYRSEPAVFDTGNPPLKETFHRTDESVPMISAHRGGSYPGFPENCLETFQYVLGNLPILIECDVEVAGDGTLVLMHDETLDRTTNGSGKVSDLNWEQLQELRLVDNRGQTTDFVIPSLQETLQWAKNKAILTLDIKRSVSFEDVVELIEREQVQENVVIITYTLEAAKKIHRLNGDLMLSVTVRNLQEFQRLKDSGIPLDQVIAFTGTSEPSGELYKELHREGIFCILGTLGNLDRMARARGDHLYEEFVERGADIIATDRPLEAGRVLQKRWKLEVPSSHQLIAD